MRPTLAFVAAGMVVFCLSGCDDAPPPQDDASNKAPTISGLDHTAEIGWLKGNDGTDPAWWMASLEAEKDPKIDRDRTADELRSLLDKARENFMETPRMIANRAVQLEDTLAERGARETARDLIVGFNSTKNPGITSRRFGDICQHYANLRSEGLDRPAALAALSGHDQAQASHQ